MLVYQRVYHVTIRNSFPIHHPRMLAARSSRVSRLQRLTRLMRIAALLPRITGLLQRGNRQLGPDLLKRVPMRPKKDSNDSNVGWGIRDLCEVWWRFKDLIYAIYGIFMVFLCSFSDGSVFSSGTYTSWLNLTLRQTRWPEAVGCWLPDFVRQEVASRLRISWPGEWVANGWQHISTYRHVNAETPRKPRNAFPPWKMA